MIPRDRVDLNRGGRAIGRLPKRMAYSLIMLVSLILWIPIGIGIAKLIRFLTS